MPPLCALCCAALGFVPTVLDDITYVSKGQAETSVLFELNQPFGEWGKVPP
jgi:hypothetical protein